MTSTQPFNTEKVELFDETLRDEKQQVDDELQYQQESLLSDMLVSMYSHELNAQRKQSMRLIKWCVMALVAIALFAFATAIVMEVMNSNKHGNSNYDEVSVTTVTSIMSRPGVGAKLANQETDSSSQSSTASVINPVSQSSDSSSSSAEGETSSSSSATSTTFTATAEASSESSSASDAGTSVPPLSSTAMYVPSTFFGSSGNGNNGTVLYSAAGSGKNLNHAVTAVWVAVLLGGAGVSVLIG